MIKDLEQIQMERIREILESVNKNPNSSNAQILKFIVGYMVSSCNNTTNQTDGYVAFMEGMESGIIEYREEK